MSTDTDQRCPECGHHIGGDDAALRRSLRWMWWIPVACCGAALAALGIWISTSIATSETGTVSGPGRFVDPPYSIEDVQALASGASNARPGLAAALLGADDPGVHVLQPGTRIIAVEFADPPTRRYRSTEIGWPFTWYWRSERRDYDDALNRTGFRRTSQAASARWSLEWIRLELPSERTGGVPTSRIFRPLAILPALLLLLGAWWAIRWVLCVMARTIGWPSDRWRTRAIAAALVASIVGFAVLTLLSERTSEACVYRSPLGQPAALPAGISYEPREGAVYLGLDLEELRRLAESGAADRRLARMILDALPDVTAGGTPKYLAAAFDTEYVMTGSSTRWRHHLSFVQLSSERYIQRPEIGPPEFVAPGAGLDVRWHEPIVCASIFPGDAGDHAVRLHLQLDLLALFLLVLLVVWLVSCAIFRRPHRVIRRRLRRNQCPACAYQLGAGSRST